MTRPRLGSFKQTNLYLDPSETDKFIESLPRDKSLSEVIREYIHDENVRKEQEKKVIGPDNSPINSVRIASVKNNTQDILDKYFGYGFMDYENYELRQEIFNKLSDKERHEVAIASNRIAQSWKSMMVTEQVRSKK